MYIPSIRLNVKSSNFYAISGVLTKLEDLISGFRPELLSSASRQALLTIPAEAQALAIQHNVDTRLAVAEAEAQSLVLLKSLDLAVGDIVHIESPLHGDARLAIQFAEPHFAREDEWSVRLIGIYVNAKNEMLKKPIEARYAPSGINRITKLGRVDAIPCLSMFSPKSEDYPDLLALCTEEQRKAWTSLEDPVLDTSSTRHALIQYRLLAAAFQECRTIYGIRHPALEALTSDTHRVETDALKQKVTELRQRGQLKPGRQILVNGARVKLLRTSIGRAFHGPTLVVKAQPVFKDGSAAGNAQIFELSGWELDQLLKAA